jgi:uncharacterized protein
MATDWKILEKHIRAVFLLPEESIHGPEHWKRVREIGLKLANENGADKEVVELFALFHDAQRKHEGEDVMHGTYGAELARELRGTLFTVSDAQFQLLKEACMWHAHGELSDDITIGTCWDADRLDLGRIGIVPHQRFLSTEAGHMFLENSKKVALEEMFDKPIFLK